MPYPWHDGETLLADDLNAAIAAAANGPPGPPGPPGVMILSGYGPPTEDAPEGTTYFDLSNGDVWQSGDAPPPAPYHAPAVNFEAPSSSLTTDSLTATASPLFALSYWVKTNPPPDTVGKHIYVSDDDSGPNAEIKAPSNPSGTTDFYCASHDSESFFDITSSVYDKTVWHHFLIAFDCGHDGPAMIGALYIDDVLDAGAAKYSEGPAFDHPMGGTGFTVGPLAGDLADVRIMFGTALLDGSGNIPEATRRLFIDADGKPVDPAVATAALGAPCMLFSGDATTFSTNQGTGGIFYMLGGTPLTDASTSPSD